MPDPRPATSPIRFVSVLLFLGGLAGCAGTVVVVDPGPAPAPAPVSPSAMPIAPCSPFEGTWTHGGKNIPITRSGQRLTVNMAAFRRPTAFGRVIGDRQIEVTFPDDATFTGVLDGQGAIRWSNGTAWQASGFSGRWRYEGRPGPLVTQFGDRLDVNMAAYGRPNAQGVLTGPSTVTVRFPDDATHAATLIGPACLLWSNGTYWTR